MGGSLEGEQLNQQGNAWLEPCQHLPPLEIALTASQGAGMKSPSLGLLRRHRIHEICWQQSV